MMHTSTILTLSFRDHIHTPLASPSGPWPSPQVCGLMILCLAPTWRSVRLLWVPCHPSESGKGAVCPYRQSRSIFSGKFRNQPKGHNRFLTAAHAVQGECVTNLVFTSQRLDRTWAVGRMHSEEGAQTLV